MTTAYIKNIVDYNGNIIHPQTITSAVYDDNNKNLLSNIMAYKSTTTTATLLASNWNSNTKIYSFEADYPSARYNIEIDIDGDNCTDEQLNAWIAAKPLKGIKNKLTAMGNIPSVDIPVIISATPNGITFTPNGITLISFIISIADTEDYNYQAENGMTWDEWVSSEYNTDGFSQTEYNVTYYKGNPITGSDVIVDGYRYITYA